MLIITFFLIDFIILISFDLFFVNYSGKICSATTLLSIACFRVSGGLIDFCIYQWKSMGHTLTYNEYKIYIVLTEGFSHEQS